MNKLPKEKRDRIALVCIGTGALLAAVYFFLIGPEYAAISQARTKTASAKIDLQDKIARIKQQDATDNEWHGVSTTLSDAERDIAFGDPNAWFYEMLRNFKGHHAVEIASYGSLSLGNVELLPHFPYKQLKITVSGTAHFHDLGKFIAAFENTYPHAQVVNLALDPASTAGADSETLAFKMDIIALVKPTGPQN